MSGISLGRRTLPGTGDRVAASFPRPGTASCIAPPLDRRLCALLKVVLLAAALSSLHSTTHHRKTLPVSAVLVDFQQHFDLTRYGQRLLLLGPPLF
ncbi:hypothetical protein K504DRAFT_505345 [Pleomassaria siparia CBS 279.74]|uniref:Uncharacterized protein n=1 Tax=Pleomassaria siparia CBS 279.74 TaxID=1314801 RepID=A0A6G1K0L3_9PLEO|nr:hypothetical protein K504DRAFT_505345 [Pleomassaria siparia CBS 279.74]